MADGSSYSINQFKDLLADTLRTELKQWEDVYLQLRKAELAKDAHWEPGQHENPDTGVQPHIETGVHEQMGLGPGSHVDTPAPDPVGSDTGIPMDGQPSNSTPGGEICPMCGQQDLPGVCTCLGPTVGAPAPRVSNTDGFDKPDPALGSDAALGGGDLHLSEMSKAEKVEVKTGGTDGFDVHKSPRVKKNSINSVMGTGGSGQSDIGVGMDTQGMGPGADVAMKEKPMKDTCEKCMKSMRLCKCGFTKAEDGLPPGFSRWHHSQGEGYKKTKKMAKADYSAHMDGKHSDCSKSNMTCSEVHKAFPIDPKHFPPPSQSRNRKTMSCINDDCKHAAPNEGPHTRVDKKGSIHTFACNHCGEHQDVTVKEEMVKEELAKEHIGFKKLTSKLAGKPGVYDAKGLAAAIGNKKYGKKGMEAKAHAAKAEPLSKPPVSEAQRKAMHAAAAGHSTIGIPKSVGKEFSDADKGGKLPARKAENLGGELHTANLPKSEKKFTKEEWIDIANEGDKEKRLKNFPEGMKETPAPAAIGDLGAPKRGQGVEIKRVASGNDQETPQMEKSNFVKASVPMAKPPTANPVKVPTSMPKMAAPKMPAGPKTPPTATPKLPGMKMNKPLGSSILPGSSVMGHAVKTEPGVNEDKGVPNKFGTSFEKPIGKGEGMGAAFGADTAGISSGQEPAVNKATDLWPGEGVPSRAESAAAPKPKFGMEHLAAGKAKLQAQGVQPHSKLGLPKPKLPGLTAPPKSFMGKEEMGSCAKCMKDEHPGAC